ncbi:hypothetical protein F2Q69_00011796 [Brassica cretica]|uniref:Uncharacterized protein n=1 Tax=Brassica cretica TaxID=69181 RepID=A0A8S9R780_BRACR|nr:hypothetical protein F2Q69_00011796 [Brassica cretica]
METSCYHERYRVVYRELAEIVSRDRAKTLKLRSSDHERKKDLIASGIESSIASWLRSCLGIELRRSEVVSWDRVTNGNMMSIRFRVRDREFSTILGAHGFPTLHTIIRQKRAHSINVCGQVVMIFFKSWNQIQSINQPRREINHRPTKKHINTISSILSSTQIGNKLFHYIRLERIASCPCWYRGRELKLISSDHEWKQAVITSGIESSIASWLRSCLEIELRRCIIPFQQQPLLPVSPSAAPSVLWDVGLDLLKYQEFYNTQRDGNLVSSDSDFWNGLMEESSNCGAQYFVVRNEVRQDQGQPPVETTVGVNARTVEEGNLNTAVVNDEGSSSTGSTHVVCSQTESRIPMQGNEVEGGMVTLSLGPTQTEKTKVITEATNPSKTPALSLTLAGGNVEGGTQKKPNHINLAETSIRRERDRG